MLASRLGGAALAGGLCVLALMPSGAPWLAWVALVPLFAALRDASARRTLAIATTYALVAGLGSTAPWLGHAARTYFELAPGTAIGVTVLFLGAIYVVHGGALGLLLLLRPRRPGAGAVLWCGAVWAAWDALRSAVFPHYPGAVLALSQHATLPVLQVASVTGVAGISFVLVAVNAGVAMALGPGPRRPRAEAALLGVTLAAASMAWGAWRLAAAAEEAAGPLVAAIDIHARAPDATVLARYLETSTRAAPPRAALLVWPESALVADLAHDRAAWAELARFVTTRGVPLLAGGPGSVPRARGFARFNSAHLLDPGRGLMSYHKRNLVPFAERWPASLGRPPAEIESLESGDDATLFTLGERRFGVLICFEITGASGTRLLAREGADFIVHLTNDVWFADAPHLPWTAVRAAESGLPIVRAANAGVSALFDRFGRRRVSSRAGAGPGVLAADVPPGAPTPYARYGDVFLGACGALVLAGCVAARRRR